MKKLFFAFVAMLAVFACNKPDVEETPVLEVSTQKITINSFGGDRVLNITSNNAWVIQADADWISFSENNGEASTQKQEVKVYIDENTATEARTAKITVKSGPLEKVVDVEQEAASATPDPDHSEWALVGSFNDWSEGSELYLSVLDEEYFVYYGFELAANDEFKFLKGGVWPPEGQEIGGNGLVEPNTIQPAGGSNIKVTEAGKYDIYLAADLTKFYVMSEGKLPAEAVEPAPVENQWGMMGCFVDNQWSTDVPMTKEGEWIVAKGAQFTELTFKIRANESWSDATNIGVAPGSAKGEINTKVSVVTAEYAKANLGGDAADIKLNGEAGTYDVYFSYEKLELYVMTPGLKPGETPAPEPEYTLDGKQWLLQAVGTTVLVDLGLYEEGAMVIALPTMDESGFGCYMYGAYEIEKADAKSGKIIFTQYDPEWDEFMDPVEYPYSELAEDVVYLAMANVPGAEMPSPYNAVSEPYEIIFDNLGGEDPSGAIENGEYWFFNGDKVMAPLAEGVTTGTLPAGNVIDGASTVKNIFTLTYDPDWTYYTIQDSYGRYLGQTDETGNITVTDVLPTDDTYAFYLWAVETGYGEACSIYNASYSYDITYSAANNNWVLVEDGYEYPETLPVLVKAENPVEEPEVPGEMEGDGTEANPYIIKTAEHMTQMRELAPVGGETWFKMANDIDLADVNWVPVNYDENFERKLHFDGCNYTISNLTCDKEASGGDYASLFGVLYGSCRNLKVDNATITSTNGCGVLGGYVGTTGLPAVVENVTITNSSVTNSGAATGGVCGNAREAKFTNVSFQGTVTGAGQDTGGFVGKLSSTYNEFNNCTVKATVVTTYGGNARCGGFIGWNSSTATTITDCQVLDGSTLTHNGTLSKAGETTCGGFIGYGDNKGVTLTITRCSADIDVNAGTFGQRNSCFIGQLAYASTVTITDSYATGSVEGSQNYFGGMIGRMAGSNTTTITNCHFSGKVKGASGVGGLVGAVDDTAVLTVTESSATGTVTNTANNCGGLVGLVSNSVEVTDSHFDGNIVVSGYAGGIVGGTGASAQKCKISRSYSTGTLTASKAYCGGIFGVSQGVASGMVVEDCWSSMNLVVAGQQCGGIVGTTLTGITIKNCFSSGDIESKTSGNAGIIGRVAKSSTISGCIAWNEKLVCGRTANDVYAPGAIAGCVQANGTYEKCWRRSDMTFTDMFMVPSDQEDINGGVPPVSSYSSTDTQSAYHGKAAAADATISSVANAIGWSEDIWDLSGDVPVLK